MQGGSRQFGGRKSGSQPRVPARAPRSPIMGETVPAGDTTVPSGEEPTWIDRLPWWVRTQWFQFFAVIAFLQAIFFAQSGWQTMARNADTTPGVCLTLPYRNFDPDAEPRSSKLSDETFTKYEKVMRATENALRSAIADCPHESCSPRHLAAYSAALDGYLATLARHMQFAHQSYGRAGVERLQSIYGSGDRTTIVSDVRGRIKSGQMNLREWEDRHDNVGYGRNLQAFMRFSAERLWPCGYPEAKALEARK